MFDHLSTVSRYMNQLGWKNYANDHEDANGQFEQNFAFSDALTSADRLIFFRYMVHTLAHQAGMAATFMPKPFGNLTGSGLHLHSSLWDAQTGDGAVRRPRRPARARPVGARVPLHRRAGRARPGDGGGHLPDGQLLQALRGRRAAVRRHLGAGLRHLRRQQPHPDAAGARGRPGGEPRLRRLGQPVPGDGGAAGRRARRHRPRPRPGRAEPRQPARPVRPRRWPAGGSGCCRRPCCTRPTSWLPTTCCARRWARRPDGDYVDYYAKVKREEFHTWHSVVSDWEIERYLTLF